ncbi:MAG: S8 family serine peptidase [Verrucomicrobiota bacterium]|jgi:subtilisin family serine protease
MKWMVKSACLVLAVLTARAGVPENWQDKVDPRLLQGAPATNEFLVILSEQADLSGATALKTKAAKGRYVFERLTEVAQRTQQPLLKTLQEKKLEYQPFWVANMICVRGDLPAIQSLAQRADTARIVANSANRVPDLLPVTAAPRITSSVEWNLSQVHAPDVWALGYTGQGVVVAGQDTGYQWNHPALINHYRGWDGTNANHNYNWHDAIHGPNPHNTGDNPCGYNLTAPCDDNSHGTHTMGTMVGDDGAGNQIGMAPGAKWIGCRNMERGWGTAATYLECFQWFLAPTDLNDQNPDPSKAPDVINNSWYSDASEGTTNLFVFQTAVENLRAAGVVVVVSAGNEGSGCSTITSPAIYDASFSVGATDSGDNIAGFSSRGPVTVDGSNRLKPDVSAPGVNIRSSVPVNSYAGGWSGTSMAGPHVVGLVALLLSAHPELRGHVDTIEHIIESSAVPRTDSQSCGDIPGTDVPNNTYGWGRVDALAALNLCDSNYLHIASITVGTNCVLSFQSALNCLYTLESRTNLEAGSWTAVPSQVDIAGNAGLLQLSQTNRPPDTARFYRVKVRVAPGP